MANKELKCPNCGAAMLAKEGGVYVCTNTECGASIQFKEGEARLTGVGEYAQLKGKVEQLEADQQDLRELLGKPEPVPADDPEEPDAGGDEEQEDDDEEDW